MQILNFWTIPVFFFQSGSYFPCTFNHSYQFLQYFTQLLHCSAFVAFIFILTRIIDQAYSHYTARTRSKYKNGRTSKWQHQPHNRLIIGHCSGLGFKFSKLWRWTTHHCKPIFFSCSWNGFYILEKTFQLGFSLPNKLINFIGHFIQYFLILQFGMQNHCNYIFLACASPALSFINSQHFFMHFLRHQSLVFTKKIDQSCRHCKRQPCCWCKKIKAVHLIKRHNVQWSGLYPYDSDPK